MLSRFPRQFDRNHDFKKPSFASGMLSRFSAKVREHSWDQEDACWMRKRSLSRNGLIGDIQRTQKLEKEQVEVICSSPS